MTTLSNPSNKQGLASDATTTSLNMAVFDEALAAIRAKQPVVLITGRAGTGKTTFIKQLLQDEEIRQVVVAPTGVAALNAGGQTIHSFFQIPPRLQNLQEMKPVWGAKRQLMKNLQRLIIDEISMVRADLLDQINHALQINRGKRTLFGGVQVVMVGDFYQLPPVLPAREAEILQAAGYTRVSAVGAKCLAETQLAHITLQRVFRQTEQEFIALLGDIRRGENLAATLQTLNAHCVRPHRDGRIPMILTGHNAAADEYNEAQLRALKGRSQGYEGGIKGEFNLSTDQLPAPQVLALKPQARVMLLKNDPDKRWVNGTLATVVRCGEKAVEVMPDGDNKSYEITPHKWERRRYNWNAAENVIESEAVGSYSQLPLKLAWASTIHKAQGLSLEDVRVDLSGGSFASGQAYVALSRATSLAGLSLTAPLTPAHILVDHGLFLQAA